MSDQPTRNLLIPFIASFAAAMLGALTCAVAIVWLLTAQTFEDDVFRVFYAGLTVLGGSIASAGLLAAIRVQRAVVLAVVGYTAVALGTVLLLRSLFVPGDYDLDAERWLGNALLIYMPGLAIAVVCFLLSLNTKIAALRVLRIVVIVVVCGTTALLTLFFAAELFDLDLIPRTMGELIGISAISGVVLSIVGTIGVAAAILLQTGMTRAPADTLASNVRLSFNCPRCRTPQSLRPGHVRCESCRARFFIDIEEPRCDCGYVLFNLTRNACPECGRAIQHRAETARIGGGTSSHESP